MAPHQRSGDSHAKVFLVSLLRRFFFTDRQLKASKTDNLGMVNLEREAEWKLEYGSANIDYTSPASIKCTGCGADLHCQDSALPGFVPYELLQTIVSNNANECGYVSELCRRCFMLRKYKFLVSICYRFFFFVCGTWLFSSM